MLNHERIREIYLDRGFRPHQCDEDREAGRRYQTAQIGAEIEAAIPRHRESSRADVPEPTELRPAPSLAEQLNELLLSVPCGGKITITYEQGPPDEEVGE